MKINTVGRKVALKDNFIELTENKLSKLDKFFSNEAVATVTVTVEKSWQTVELSVKDRKMSYRCEKTADKMEDALEFAVEGIELQIVKNKGKLSKKHKKFGYEYFEAEITPEEDYKIERKKIFELEPQTIDDAILDMNMSGHTFYMFKDIVTEEINVVYKRKDGNYGVLIPQ